MKLICPRCRATKQSIRKFGHFYRKSDSRKIQRLHCQACGKHFSYATYSDKFAQKKRRINEMVRLLLVSEVSHRRIAMLLKINRKTVRRKQRFLAARAERKHKDRFECKLFDHVLLDDLETIEHTKLKPVTVPLIVSDCRKILGFKVARIPAKGHLAKISKKKYGIRANEAPVKRDELFSEIAHMISPQALVKSDCHPGYPELIKKHLPESLHQTYKSDRSCVAGQGELKRKKFDPIFKVNHTLAMLRANVHRLIRRTWNTTKCLESLEEQLWIYLVFHNETLT